MELLQNRRYKAGEIPDSFFNEIKMQIEIIIEVCQEGNISVHEAENILHTEILCSMDYQSELWEKMYNLENGIEDPAKESTETTSGKYCLFSPDEIADLEQIQFSSEEMANIEKITKKWEKDDLETALENMEKYNSFILDIKDKLPEILESADYQKMRKERIKQQIIRDGLTPEKVESTYAPVSTFNLADRFINNLITLYPKFENDCLLLIKEKYFEKTQKGLHWLKAKQALAEYFEDIKPDDWVKMKWTPIENAFGEKDLKHSLSNNGNAFKDKSIDFKNWLKIKKN